ncbi:MAG TPA: SulP family inorganic anion transporter [Candidatus Thermoplasmatota archaeon]|nr:SulP family inorganic anion transporter [Candidatus Thermoplasmatota archaeon]
MCDGVGPIGPTSMSKPIASSPPPQPTLRQLRRFLHFKPAFIEALRGYKAGTFYSDVMAGLVVGIVALPLAIAFSIASGADPRAGLVTAALAGFVVALFGGSRVQIAGPTGAFVVILYGITQGYGFEKLLIATFIAGVLLFLFGLFRLGQLIKFIPYPVTTGFTAGIAVIIFLGQVPDLLGLRPSLAAAGATIPADALGKVEVIAAHIDGLSLAAVGVAVATIIIIQAVKRIIPKVPGPAVALALLTPLAYFLPQLANIQTVGDLFTIPQGLPTFDFPEFSGSTLREMFVPSITIALLGAIESLLSAVVADGMAGTKHDSNQELMGQGLANMIVPLFGGIAATGAIARTGTNVQMGARTPVASVVHGLVVLAVLIAAAPLVAYIPMAVLAGILAVVSWNMSERHRFAQLLKMPLADAGVMLATFALTILIDLTVAVEIGMVLAAALFIGRMSAVTSVNLTVAEDDPLYKLHSLEGKDIPAGVQLYTIEGPFFFGAAEKFQAIIERIGKEPKVVIFRVRRVPYLDATGLNAFSIAVHQLQRHNIVVVLSAVQTQPLDMMMRSGFTKLIGDDNIQPNIDAALARVRIVLGLPAVATDRPTASST